MVTLENPRKKGIHEVRGSLLVPPVVFYGVRQVQRTPTRPGKDSNNAFYYRKGVTMARKANYSSFAHWIQRKASDTTEYKHDLLFFLNETCGRPANVKQIRKRDYHLLSI